MYEDRIYSSGDGEGGRIIGSRDHEGKRWCFPCYEAQIARGTGLPQFVEDLTDWDQYDRRAKCSQCGRLLMDRLAEVSR